MRGNIRVWAYTGLILNLFRLNGEFQIFLNFRMKKCGNSRIEQNVAQKTRTSIEREIEKANPENLEDLGRAK